MSTSDDVCASSPRGITTKVTVILVTLLLVVSGFLIAFIVKINSAPQQPTTYPMATFLPSSTLHVGQSIPMTPSLHDLIGPGSASLTGIAGHHPLVINFFASYCTACAQEMRTFATVAASEHRVVFVGIDTSDPNVPKARSLIASAGVAYPVLEDNAKSIMLNTFGIANLPTTFFVNASGTIVAEVLGLETAPQLRAHLAKI